jgi:hypothetical protein
MKRLWIPIAIGCLVIAIVRFIQLNFESAFVVAAIGAVAWFLNYRARVNDRLEDDLKDHTFDEGQEPDEDDSAHNPLS